jgi:ABC-2 type transport system permease protein
VTLYAHALRRLRSQIMWFSIGLGVWGAMYIFLFPVMQESMSQIDYPAEILEAFGAGSGNIGDPRVFFDIEFFSLGPSIMAVYAVIAGTGALAGEESAGTMDFIAALPISRRRLFVQKALAVATGATLVAVLTASIAWIATAPWNDIGGDLTVLDLVIATLAMVPFVLLVAAIGMLLGAVSPSRASAAAWTGGFVVIAYLVVAIASITDSVEWFRYLSPYYYTDLPGILEDGLDGAHQAVLWAMIAAVTLAGLRAFEGRELAAERWQWRALFTSGTEPTMTTGASSGGTAPIPPRPRRGSQRNWLILIGVLALVGLVVGVLAAGGGESLRASSQQRTLAASGRIDADSATLAAPTTGIAHLVLAREGDEVRQGQVLAWLTSAVDGSEQPVVAPLAGDLTAFTLARGQSVVVGTPVGEVHNLDTLRAVLEVEEKSIDTIAAGQRAELTITTLDRRITTHVASIAVHPISEAGTARDKPKYEVRCPLPTDDPRLVIGLRVEARIDRVR